MSQPSTPSFHVPTTDDAEEVVELAFPFALDVARQAYADKIKYLAPHMRSRVMLRAAAVTIATAFAPSTISGMLHFVERYPQVLDLPIGTRPTINTVRAALREAIIVTVSEMLLDPEAEIATAEVPVVSREMAEGQA